MIRENLHLVVSHSVTKAVCINSVLRLRGLKHHYFYVFFRRIPIGFCVLACVRLCTRCCVSRLTFVSFPTKLFVVLVLVNEKNTSCALSSLLLCNVFLPTLLVGDIVSRVRLSSIDARRRFDSANDRRRIRRHRR